MPYFSEKERAAIAEIARREKPLSAELLLMRLKLRGVFAYLGRQDLAPEERVRVTQLLVRGARAVAQLLRAQQLLQAQNTLEQGAWTTGSGDGVGYLLEQVLAAEEKGASEGQGTRAED